jgi:hypothetical protein
MAQTQDTLVPRKHHEWGHFPKGAWKKSRVITETLDPATGKVVKTSTSETKVTLDSVDNQAATLHVETTVEVGGKRFDREPQTVRHRFGGLAQGKVVSLKTLGPGSVVIDGKKIPTEIREIVIQTASGRWTSKIHYNDSVKPYVLRRENSSTDTGTDAPQSTTRVDVIAVDMPYRLKADTMTTSVIRTTHSNGKGRTITLEIRSEEIPGGVISHSAKHIVDGKVVSRTTLELIEYSSVGERTSRLGRARRNRQKRKACLVAKA